jgi:hypothetical protein
VIPQGLAQKSDAARPEWWLIIGANILFRVRAQDPIMPEGLLPILVLIAVVIIYTIAKVIDYSRQSDQQWRDVDKSKLREWEDDD